jgi:hypothetical protein
MFAFISEDTPALRPSFIADFKLLPQHYQNLIADVNFCNTRTSKKRVLGLALPIDVFPPYDKQPAFLFPKSQHFSPFRERCRLDNTTVNCYLNSSKLIAAV